MRNIPDNIFIVFCPEDEKPFSYVSMDFVRHTHAACTRRPLESKYNNKAIFSSYMTNNDNARIRTHAITHTVFITCSSNSESPVLSARASHTRQKSATIDSKIWTDNNVRSNFICHRQRRLNDDAAAAVAR